MKTVPGKNSPTTAPILGVSVIEQESLAALDHDFRIPTTPSSSMDILVEKLPEGAHKATMTSKLAGFTDAVARITSDQDKIRRDRTRNSAEKLFILNQRVKTSQKVIDNMVSDILQAALNNANAAKDQLFSTTAHHLTQEETSMLPTYLQALTKPDSRLATNTMTESKITLHLLATYPSLINPILEPTQSLGGLASDMDTRFSPEAKEEYFQNKDLLEATQNLMDSFIEQKEKMLPSSIIQELEASRA